MYTEEDRTVVKSRVGQVWLDVIVLRWMTCFIKRIPLSVSIELSDCITALCRWRWTSNSFLYTCS